MPLRVPTKYGRKTKKVATMRSGERTPRKNWDGGGQDTPRMSCQSPTNVLGVSASTTNMTSITDMKIVHRRGKKKMVMTNLQFNGEKIKFRFGPSSPFTYEGTQKYQQECDVNFLVPPNLLTPIRPRSFTPPTPSIKPRELFPDDELADEWDLLSDELTKEVYVFPSNIV